ncbi:MAG: hypothetical protein AAGA99_27475 [Actinomycetota bacterium]
MVMRTYSLAERTLASHRAGEVGSRIGAVDGVLTVTDTRVVFQPTLLERLLGGQRWELTYGDVASIEIKPQDWKGWRTWVNAGCSPTIVITDAAGSSHELVIRKLRRFARLLSSEVDGEALPAAA